MPEKRNIVSRITRFYVEGFKSMTNVGRSLWLLIIIKVIIMFAVLKIFFFPDILSDTYNDDGERAEAVRNALIERR